MSILQPFIPEQLNSSNFYRDDKGRNRCYLDGIHYFVIRNSAFESYCGVDETYLVHPEKYFQNEKTEKALVSFLSKLGTAIGITSLISVICRYPSKAVEFQQRLSEKLTNNNSSYTIEIPKKISDSVDSSTLKESIQKSNELLPKFVLYLKIKESFELESNRIINNFTNLNNSNRLSSYSTNTIEKVNCTFGSRTNNLNLIKNTSRNTILTALNLALEQSKMDLSKVFLVIILIKILNTSLFYLKTRTFPYLKRIFSLKGGGNVENLQDLPEENLEDSEEENLPASPEKRLQKLFFINTILSVIVLIEFCIILLLVTIIMVVFAI
jgi:hypothetical protein